VEKKIFEVEKKFSKAKKFRKKRSKLAQKEKNLGLRAYILESFSEIFREVVEGRSIRY
jgi:hypothetical protein